MQKASSYETPMISSRTAALLSILFTALYVLPFYLSKRTRPSPNLNRDAPSVIQARVRSVTITVFFSTMTTAVLTVYYGRLSWIESLHRLGIWPIYPMAILPSLLTALIVFAGPLYKDVFIDGNLWPPSAAIDNLRMSLHSSMGYRNYIAGPLTEELLFRSTILPIHLLSPLISSPKKLVFLTPLYFGVAHIHHFYEFKLTHPHTPLLPILLRTIFQFAFTTVFGWYAAFVFLRTGSLYAVILIHAFCNYMGFPQLWGRVGNSGVASSTRYAVRYSRDGETTGLDSDKAKPGFLGDVQSRQTLTYYTLLISGLVGFIFLLGPLTRFPALALVDFG